MAEPLWTWSPGGDGGSAGSWQVPLPESRTEPSLAMYAQSYEASCSVSLRTPNLSRLDPGAKRNCVFPVQADAARASQLPPLLPMPPSPAINARVPFASGVQPVVVQCRGGSVPSRAGGPRGPRPPGWWNWRAGATKREMLGSRPTGRSSHCGANRPVCKAVVVLQLGVEPGLLRRGAVALRRGAYCGRRAYRCRPRERGSRWRPCSSVRGRRRGRWPARSHSGWECYRRKACRGSPGGVLVLPALPNRAKNPPPGRGIRDCRAPERTCGRGRAVLPPALRRRKGRPGCW